jgi:hypothetical protein
MLLGAGIAIALAACGSPSYEYVRNTEARTAFKVPIDWTVYDEAALQGEPTGPPVSTPDPVEWLVGLDGHPSPSIEHVLGQGAYDSDYPQGKDQVGREAVQILAYDDRLDKDGFRGLHFEAQIWASALEQNGAAGGGQVLFDDRFVQISQTAYLDPASDKVYVLAVLCSAECYGRNRGDIESVIESWAVIA